VLSMLAARGVALSSQDRERICGEREIETLERWIVVAAICANAGDLFS
jgi:hypothetical protein